MIIDEVVWKQLGYTLVAVWGFLGLALLDYLLSLPLSPLWTITIEGIWYSVDGLILFYIHYIFKIIPVETVEPPIRI